MDGRRFLYSDEIRALFLFAFFEGIFRFTVDILFMILPGLTSGQAAAAAAAASGANIREESFIQPKSGS